METNLTLIKLIDNLIYALPDCKLSYEYKPIVKEVESKRVNLRASRDEKIDCWYLMSIYTTMGAEVVKKTLIDNPCIIRKLELIAPIGLIKTGEGTQGLGIEQFFFHSFRINLVNPKNNAKEYIEFDSRSIRRYGNNVQYLTGIKSGTYTYNKPILSNSLFERLQGVL